MTLLLLSKQQLHTPIIIFTMTHQCGVAQVIPSPIASSNIKVKIIACRLNHQRFRPPLQLHGEREVAIGLKDTIPPSKMDLAQHHGLMKLIT
jgi:hypothetical protein